MDAAETQSPSTSNMETTVKEQTAQDKDEGDCDQDEYSYLKEELSNFMKEAEQSLAVKTELLRRNKNAATKRPDPDEIAKRDPNVKKNSGFIKKLRSMVASQVEQLIKECQCLNLSKYLSEAAAAIVEAKLKFTDIPSAVLFCTELNCTYSEFAAFLQDEYVKVLQLNKHEPVANGNRLKVELCFYAELSLCGVIPPRHSLPVLSSTLATLAADRSFKSLNLMLSFCKHCGPDIAGLVPRRIRLLCDQFNETLNISNLLTPSKQEIFRKLFHDYYTSLCRHLHNEQEKVSVYEKQNRQTLEAKGDLNPSRLAKAEAMRVEIQSLLGGVVTLAELLDTELPDLPDSDLQDLLLGGGEELSGGDAWEDEETRQFYTELPDVKEFVAQLNNNQAQDEAQEKNATKVGENMFKPEEADTSNKRYALDQFLKMLPQCHTKVAIDNAALEFLLYFNNKSGRKKLIITLYTVPRNSLELLPLYARFVAILNPVIPEVASTLCQQLKSEMLRHIHKKDQDKLESKKKTLKFIGELVNFGVYAKKEALRSLKLLLYDFTHHNIDVACALLETCGCVLYSTSDTHLSTKYYLEQMMRMKTMMALDTRYVVMIENTYYQILPPEGTLLPAAVPLSPIQQFIAKTIYQELMQPGSDLEVLNLLRSLDWDDNEVVSYVVKCLTDASRLGYPRIRALANVASMLAEHQEDSMFRVVDGVLEDIRLGMELNEASMNQRRVAMIKYLGELYNYRLLDSSDVLKVLYSLISFGVAPEQDVASPLDPPTNVIRIHLVLLLLTTCAFPMNSQDTVKKLTYFCTYFQRYYWKKRCSPVWLGDQPFPRDIVHRFEDVLLSLCPESVLANNLEEANNSAINLNNKMCSELSSTHPDIASILGTVFEDSESSEEEHKGPEKSKEIQENNLAFQTETVEEENADEEFAIELSKMVSENFREAEANKTKPNTDIAVPLNYKKSIANDQLQFVVLLRKGNKQTCKTLEIPTDENIFGNLKSNEEAYRKEKEKVKRLTLDINQRLQDV